VARQSGLLEFRPRARHLARAGPRGRRDKSHSATATVSATVSATVCPGRSGHVGAGKRAPMLGKCSQPGKLTGTAAPAAPTLDRESPGWPPAACGSSPGGATGSATPGFLVSRFAYFRHSVCYCACSLCDLTGVVPPPNCSAWLPTPARRRCDSSFCLGSSMPFQSPHHRPPQPPLGIASLSARSKNAYASLSWQNTSASTVPGLAPAGGVHTRRAVRGDANRRLLQAALS